MNEFGLNQVIGDVGELIICWEIMNEEKKDEFGEPINPNEVDGTYYKELSDF